MTMTPRPTLAPIRPSPAPLSDAALRLYCTAWACDGHGPLVWTLETMQAATGIPLARLPQVRRELEVTGLWSVLGADQYHVTPIAALRTRLRHRVSTSVLPPTPSTPTRSTRPPFLPRTQGPHGGPPPISKETAWTIFAQASAIVGTRALPGSQYARTAIARLYTRLREGHQPEDFLTVARAAAARTASGDQWPKLRSLVYCWSLGFPELLAVAKGSSNGFRQGPDLETWAAKARPTHIPDPLTGH